MMRQQQIRAIMMAAWLSLPSILYGGQGEEFGYNFIQEDTYYSFHGSFVVKAEPDCILDVAYDFKHIAKYASGAESIALVRQGENWNEVAYIYRKFMFFKNKSTWRRTLKRDEQKVVFEMISSKNNMTMMPKIVSSTGYYQIKQEKEGCRVEYYQECTLEPGFLKDTYINNSKKAAIQFIREFKAYVENACGRFR